MWQFASRNFVQTLHAHSRPLFFCLAHHIMLLNTRKESQLGTFEIKRLDSFDRHFSLKAYVAQTTP